MNKVKSILLKVDFEGRGIVNFDSSNQKFLFMDNNLRSKFFNKNDNNSYSKKVLYMDGENLAYKVKVSGATLKKNMFGDDLVAQSANIIHNDVLLYQYIASPMGALRGYMFADKTETEKRKGPIGISDAIQTCTAVSLMEFFSKSGEKIKRVEGDNIPDTSLYNKETVGDIKYTTLGSIDLQELSFVSCDNIFGRYGFNPDKFPLYKSCMNVKMPNFNSELGYYKLSTSSIDLPEYGFKFSNENVNFLVRKCLERILAINITTNGSFCRTAKLKVKLVTNPLFDKHSDEDGWVTIDSQEDLDTLIFDSNDFYQEVNLEEAKAYRISVEETLKQAIKTTKAEKETSAKNTADKKATAIANKKAKEELAKA